MSANTRMPSSGSLIASISALLFHETGDCELYSHVETYAAATPHAGHAMSFLLESCSLLFVDQPERAISISARVERRSAAMYTKFVAIGDAGIVEKNASSNGACRKRQVSTDPGLTEKPRSPTWWKTPPSYGDRPWVYRNRPSCNLLKLVTGVEISTRLPRRVDNDGKAVKRTRRRRTPAASTDKQRLSMFVYSGRFRRRACVGKREVLALGGRIVVLSRRRVGHLTPPNHLHIQFLGS